MLKPLTPRQLKYRGPGTIPQQRAQHLRSMLGSLGSAIQHAGSSISSLKAEAVEDTSMKTSLNRLMIADLEKLITALVATKNKIETLNDHYRNYPKPTPTKFEKLVIKEELDYAARQQNLNRTSDKQ